LKGNRSDQSPVRLPTVNSQSGYTDQANAFDRLHSEDLIDPTIQPGPSNGRETNGNLEDGPSFCEAVFAGDLCAVSTDAQNVTVDAGLDRASAKVQWG
jgi:hypothetical protein